MLCASSSLGCINSIKSLRLVVQGDTQVRLLDQCNSPNFFWCTYLTSLCIHRQLFWRKMCWPASTCAHYKVELFLQARHFGSLASSDVHHRPGRQIVSWGYNTWWYQISRQTGSWHVLFELCSSDWRPDGLGSHELLNWTFTQIAYMNNMNQKSGSLTMSTHCHRIKLNTGTQY